MTHNPTEKLIDELHQTFPCIDANCDNNGVTWHVVVGHDSYGEPEPQQEQLQCRYCHEVRFPVLNFLHKEIPILLQEDREAGRKEIEDILRPRLEYIASRNDLHNNVCILAAKEGLEDLKVARNKVARNRQGKLK